MSRQAIRKTQVCVYDILRRVWEAARLSPSLEEDFRAVIDMLDWRKGSSIAADIGATVMREEETDDDPAADLSENEARWVEAFRNAA